MRAKQNIISKDKLVDFLPMRGNVFGAGGGGWGVEKLKSNFNLH